MANKKRYYNNRSKKQNHESVIEQTAKFSQEQLSLSTEDLGISEATRELLAKNRILTAADFVKRTEKDMYKVQGLNKKILFEVKDALKAKDMSLRPEPPNPKMDNVQNGKTPQNAQKEQSADVNGDQKRKNDKKQNSQKSEKLDRRTNDDTNAKAERTSKFGLSDRASSKPQNKQNQTVKQNDKKSQKSEKLNEPLKQGQWRKVLKGGKWGYSDGFKIVIPTMYDEIFAFKEGLASVEIDEKCGYIDEQNNVVIPLDYDTAMSFSEGLAMVCRGEKCGYINKNNEVVIPFEFDAATPFENGEAKVKKDGKWGTITTEGKITWI